MDNERTLKRLVPPPRISETRDVEDDDVNRRSATNVVAEPRHRAGGALAAAQRSPAVA